MAYRFLLFATFSFTFFTGLQAQDDRPYRIYATQQVHKKLLSENPDFANQLVAIENHIKNYGTLGEGRKDTISVVFHILYALGQAYPNEVQIQAQLDALNRDFQHYEAPPESYTLDKVQQLANLAISPEIYFCLPDYDASGNPVSPIHYVETTVAEWAANDSIKFGAAGGTNVWDAGQFLNVWVGHLGNGKAGYAQPPGGPNATDGIVLDSRYLIGSGDTLINKIYYQGKTLTHLVGSYLGLHELWNELEPCQDDYVDDTPIHNAPNYFPGDIYYHISLCDTTYRTEMIMNFMDNTDDEVLNMFTQGQKNRMKAVLAPDGARGNLASGVALCGASDLRDSKDENSNKRAINPTLRVYPNPATQTANLQLNSSQPGNVVCTVVNLLGATVWSDELYIAGEPQLLRVDCSTWGQGVYIIKAVFGDGTVAAKKLVIETP